MHDELIIIIYFKKISIILKNIKYLVDSNKYLNFLNIQLFINFLYLTRFNNFIDK